MKETSTWSLFYFRMTYFRATYENGCIGNAHIKPPNDNVMNWYSIL